MSAFYYTNLRTNQQYYQLKVHVAGHSFDNYKGIQMFYS